MSIDSQHHASEVFDQPVADEPELRSQVLNNMLNVSTYLVSVLDPNELLTSLARRVVEVVPAVQAGLLWLRDQQQGAIQIVYSGKIKLESCSACQLRCPSCPTTTGATRDVVGRSYLRAADFGVFDYTRHLSLRLAQIALSGFAMANIPDGLHPLH